VPLNGGARYGNIALVHVTGDALEKRLRLRLDDTQTRWFDDALQRTTTGAADDLLRAYTDASRHLGRTPLRADDTAAEAPAEPRVDPVAHWTLEDAGRLLLLLTRSGSARDKDRCSSEISACYEQGDSREQQSWLRAVAFLPDPQRYLPLVIDTCRTNILPLFEAVACENPYPARYFPERNFNQMVLKAMFNGIALARIHGLADRANPELARMAQDYAAERRAAGRSVPADIALATAAAVERNDR
jgi:hypothetical protein